MVGLTVGHFWYDIGSDSFLNAWFSTIGYHLEKGKWGSKYPLLMNEFYQGALNVENLDGLKNEVFKVQDELKQYEPSEVVWDIRNLEAKPPWGDDISEEITDLSNYFVTSNGEDLFEVLFLAIDQAIADGQKLEIDNM